MRWYKLPLPGKRKGLPCLAAALCQGLWASQNCAVDVQALCLPRQNGFQMRARVGFYPGCQGTPRVKRFQKSRLFSDRGAKPFLWSAFLSGNFFLCAVLCGCAGVEGAFPCGGVPSWPKEEKRLPRPLPARGARLQIEAEPGYFPFQNLRLSGGRSNHTAQPFWKNLPKIRAFFFIGTNVLLVVQMPLALLSTSLSSTLPCS